MLAEHGKGDAEAVVALAVMPIGPAQKCMIAFDLRCNLSLVFVECGSCNLGGPSGLHIAYLPCNFGQVPDPGDARRMA